MGNSGVTPTTQPIEHRVRGFGNNEQDRSYTLSEIKGGLTLVRPDIEIAPG